MRLYVANGYISLLAHTVDLCPFAPNEVRVVNHTSHREMHPPTGSDWGGVLCKTGERHRFPREERKEEGYTKATGSRAWVVIRSIFDAVF